jgi:hypothetical protein
VRVVSALVLTPRGSVAWTEDQYSNERGCAKHAVTALEGDKPVTLDSSNAIRLKSLRWKCGRIRWRHGDETRSAPLL